MMNNSITDVHSSSVPSSSHQALYKHKGVSSNVLHQKHREETIELRKKKRDNGFTRARRLLELSREQVVEPELRSVFDQGLISDLTSGEDERVFSALQVYSRLFSSAECVDQMHEIELVNVIVDIFMRSEALSNLEAICIIVLSKLSNEFDRISCFLNPGIIAKLVNSLGSPNSETLEHAVFLLEEIVRHDPYTRSTCDELQLLSTSIKLYLSHDQLSLRRQILTMMSNYFEYEVLLHGINKDLLDFLHFVVLNEADEILLTDAFAILVKIAQFSQSHAELLVSEGFLSESIPFLKDDIANSCMALVKAIVGYGEDYVKVLSELGYFETVWSIANSNSNLSKKRGNAYALIATFINSGYLRLNPNAVSSIAGRLIESLNESAFEVRRQSLFAIEQLLAACSDADILIQFTQSTCLASLCDLLTVMHVETVLRSINCLDTIMDYGVANGIDVELRIMLESHNAPEKFDFLTNSQSYEVFKKADAFINKYLSDASGDELDLRCGD